MSEVIPISEAKTNLSKLVQRARAGETIYLGAYGRAEAILAPLPKRRKLAFGHGRPAAGADYGAADLIESDPEVLADFEESLKRDA